MNKTIRVAITSERINNRSYELTAKTFLDLTLFELCTPIVYGSKKDAEAVFKSLETQPNWTSVRQAEEAQDGRLNIIDTPADSAYARALDDCLQQRVEVMVVLGTAPQDMGPQILVTDDLRIFVPNEPLSNENVEAQAKVFKSILRRDFMLSAPRIALLQPAAPEGEALPVPPEGWNEVASLFGPYNAEQFDEANQYSLFDGILPTSRDQAKVLFAEKDDAQGATLITGQPFVVTASSLGNKSALTQNADDPTVGQPLRNAIYLALDVFRRRINYDRPYKNPLPKLYHEKKDESEKVRFTIPKAKTEKQKEE